MLQEDGDIAKRLLLGYSCDTCYYRLKYFMDNRAKTWYCSKLEYEPWCRTCIDYINKRDVLQ